MPTDAPPQCRTYLNRRGVARSVTYASLMLARVEGAPALAGARAPLERVHAHRLHAPARRGARSGARSARGTRRSCGRYGRCGPSRLARSVGVGGCRTSLRPLGAVFRLVQAALLLRVFAQLRKRLTDRLLAALALLFAEPPLAPLALGRPSHLADIELCRAVPGVAGFPRLALRVLVPSPVDAFGV